VHIPLRVPLDKTVRICMPPEENFTAVQNFLPAVTCSNNLPIDAFGPDRAVFVAH